MIVTMALNHKYILSLVILCTLSYYYGYYTPRSQCNIRTGLQPCKIDDENVCTKEGCFVSPSVIEKGPPIDHLFNSKATPSFVVFKHVTGYILSEVYNTSSMTTIACIQLYTGETKAYTEL